jgi:hypothetical protein
LIHLPTEGLGRIQNELVAVKRMYRSRTRKADSNSWAVRSYSSADEYAKRLPEANLLFWAASLMAFTYSFIDHFISEAKRLPETRHSDISFESDTRQKK